MTEHFTRTEAATLAKAAGFEVRRGLGLRESVPEDVFARGLINEEVTALCNAAAVAAKLKEWEAQAALATQGDKAYKRGFSDGMKEAPTGESWIRAIDEAMVGAHIGVAEMADDYGTAKKKLNALICWSVQVDRDLSRAQATPTVGAQMTTEDLMKLLGDFPEINPSNYGDDDVNALNAWGIAAHTALEALGREVEQWKVDFNEVLIERDQARAQLAAIRATQEPVAYWVPKAEQFCIADKRGRPFAKAWEPLYASPAAKDAGLVADGWKPIETAPKDGRPILLFGDERVTCGHWSAPSEVPRLIYQDGFAPEPEWDEWEPYWASWDGGFTDDHPPTNWMPLPASPKIGGV